jgi:hypothetical protein
MLISRLEEPEGSAGHALGQLIGDWWERYICLPQLEIVAKELQLYLDSRFKERTCRGEKLQWADATGQTVDYDFVLELGGSAQLRGIPVGFIEVFWRRGSRHSRDKARDDSGKLLPMRQTYPTARFLGMMAAGDFSRPAIDFLNDRFINLLFIPKEKIVGAFAAQDLIIDYPDRTPEVDKRILVDSFRRDFTQEKKQLVAQTLVKDYGQSNFSAYLGKINSFLSASPQEIKIYESLVSPPMIFHSVSDASRFLEKPVFSHENNQKVYQYEILFSDGSYFSDEVDSLDALKKLHAKLKELSQHVDSLHQR